MCLCFVGERFESGPREVVLVDFLLLGRNRFGAGVSFVLLSIPEEPIESLFFYSGEGQIDLECGHFETEGWHWCLWP